VSNPKRVLIWMLLFLCLVGGAGWLFFEQLARAFLANDIFNGMILGVLLIGIIINFRQVFVLGPDVEWIDAVTDGRKATDREPRLLMPMAKMLTGRNKQRTFRMSALTMRSLLDGIRMRLDESRDISHYLIGLLIFLGLLGTFWGLLDTVAGVAGVISGLSGGTVSDPGQAFATLTQRLETPLGGMATAFSSSLFGLSGALVVGFLDLQAGHAQNRFSHELEEWLAELTHLSSGALGIEQEATVPAYIEGLLEQTAESLNQLQRILIRIEESRVSDYAQQADLNTRLAEMNDHMRSEQKQILNLSRGLSELTPAISRMADRAELDIADTEELRSHMRSIDAGITRLLNEMAAGRKEMMGDLRQELRLLHRVLGARTDGRDQG